MELEKARKIALEIEEKLNPFCEKIAIVGSIRRQKSWVRDIDIVCIPGNQGMFLTTLRAIGKFKVSGPKIIRVSAGFTLHIDIDVYIASPETWATLLLIRTGSASHNVYLCGLARSKGMILHADGSGLEKCLPGQGTEVDNTTTSKINCDSETSIFQALGLPYIAPEKRE